jgi:hypothetical protein
MSSLSEEDMLELRPAPPPLASGRKPRLSRRNWKTWEFARAIPVSVALEKA